MCPDSQSRSLLNLSLQDFQNLLNQSINQLPIGIWITDHQGTIVFGNQTGKEIWGEIKYVGTEQFEEYQAWTLPDKKKISAQQWAAARAVKNGDITLEEEILIKSFDGKYKTILNTALPIKNQQGQITHCLVINQDITQLRQQQHELAESLKKNATQAQENEMFRLAVNQSAEHIIITDADGIVVFANSAVEKITGYSCQEVIGSKAGKLWSKPMEPQFYQHMWDVIKNQKKPFKGELENRRKNGELYSALVSISPVLNDQGEIQYFVAVERDISAERAIDQAKTDFVSFASHQLRTPLTAIKWYSELLADEINLQLSPDQQDYLHKVRQATDNMIDLISALLNVSRIEMGSLMVEPEQVKLAQEVDNVLSDLEVSLKNNQTTIIKKLDPEIILNLDKKLFKIVIENLVSNANKYSPAQSEITIELMKLPANQEYYWQSFVEDGIVLSVCDQGIGIPSDQKEQIFAKLFRAHNAIKHSTSGTGLGLYITKSIIDFANGKIWFESEPNQGSCFHIWLSMEGMSAQDGTKSLETSVKNSQFV